MDYIKLSKSQLWLKTNKSMVTGEQPNSYQGLTNAWSESTSIPTEQWCIDKYTEVQLLKAKYDKLESLSTWYEGLLDYGFSVPGESYRLKLREVDRYQFTGQLTLISLYLSNPESGVTTSTTTQIKDIDGNLITLTIGTLQLILSLYGGYYNTIWKRYNDYISFINSYTSLTETKTNSTLGVTDITLSNLSFNTGL